MEIKTKNILIIAIILVLLIIATILFLQYRNSILNKPEPEPATQTNQAGVIVVEDKTITDNTKPFKIAITYPYIEGQDEFNAKVQDAIKTYTKYPREYDLTISYTKGEVDENVISVMLSIANFEGGAHGAQYFVPVNYDVKNKKEIVLADLFAGQPDYLQKVSTYCMQDLTEQLTKSLGNLNGTWIKDGAGPKEENFQAFLIQKDTIVFYFPQYQVAFYAAGSFQVTMPR